MTEFIYANIFSRNWSSQFFSHIFQIEFGNILVHDMTEWEQVHRATEELWWREWAGMSWLQDSNLM